jgi:adenylate cyclase
VPATDPPSDFDSRGVPALGGVNGWDRRKADAIAFYERASAARPEDYQAPLLVGQIHEDLGQLDQARAARQRGVKAAQARLDHQPDDIRALYMGANGLVALGEIEKGLQSARRARELEPDDAMLLYNLACIHALACDTETTLTCLEEARAQGFANRDWIERDSNLDSIREQPRFRLLLERMVV